MFSDTDDCGNPSAQRTELITTRTDEELEVEDARDAGSEYDELINKWCTYKVPWKTIYDKEELGWNKDDTAVIPFEHLMDADVSKMMKEINSENKRLDNLFGFLPDMCKNSRCQLGALASQSFAERMNSCANLLLTKNRLTMSDDAIEKFVVLRMNKDFMQLMRENNAMCYYALRKMIN
jgi:hypothetical protein